MLINLIVTQWKSLIKNEVQDMRYEAVLGFNTKQWWVYDNDEDEYIDPPSSVLAKIRDYSDDVNMQQSFLNGILTTEPEWLYHKGYRYNGEDIEI